MNAVVDEETNKVDSIGKWPRTDCCRAVGRSFVDGGRKFSFFYRRDPFVIQQAV